MYVLNIMLISNTLDNAFQQLFVLQKNNFNNVGKNVSFGFNLFKKSS